jgi:hypothetical protein
LAQPNATVLFFLFQSNQFNSISNQIQTSEIHKNLIIFE